MLMEANTKDNSSRHCSRGVGGSNIMCWMAKIREHGARDAD
jgi:hypothetical protein